MSDDIPQTPLEMAERLRSIVAYCQVHPGVIGDGRDLEACARQIERAQTALSPFKQIADAMTQHDRWLATIDYRVADIARRAYLGKD